MPNYERETIEAILDEAIVSHVGTVSPDGHPIVIPTLHARAGDWLYIHGSAASPTLRRAEQAEICLTATLLDGLVLARSAVHHSVNYRSVVVFGQAEKIEDAEGKCEALKAFTEKLDPGPLGRRPPPNREGAEEQSGCCACRSTEASAKIRDRRPARRRGGLRPAGLGGHHRPPPHRQLTKARRPPPPRHSSPQLPHRARKRPNLRASPGRAGTSCTFSVSAPGASPQAIHRRS